MEQKSSNGVPMSRLRILLLAPNCDPTDVSIPLVTYCHGAALAELHDVVLVIRSSVEDRVREARGNFRTIAVVRMPMLEHIWAWALKHIFKYNFDTQALTAFTYPFS